MGLRQTPAKGILRKAYSRVRMCLLTALLLAPGLRADTYSEMVAILERPLMPGQTTTISCPLAALPGDDDVETSSHAALQAASAAADQLHIWQTYHFLSYTYSAEAQGWQIPATSATMPAARMPRLRGGGCLFSRIASLPGMLRVYGAAPMDASHALSLAARTWTLISSPYPVVLTLEDLRAAGAGLGDQVRLWQTDTGDWRVFELADAGWEATGDGGKTELGIAEAALYFNAGTAPRTLHFQRPYPEASRP